MPHFTVAREMEKILEAGAHDLDHLVLPTLRPHEAGLLVERQQPVRVA